ncbi:hypothetical protein [Candidatus Parabeggiatoa sp. HSG14]|uniref:hypothetical protein n=1 Tax=Candidatus Parabeggiatoa sp. HSG14 TaxID=3055593 RepID=UPI0025A72786|nr:hypothetical protein [Thiotrichales bacterium HSG14]
MKIKLFTPLFLLLFLCGSLVQADPTYKKPYVLANSASSDEVKANLTAQGFEIAGEYEASDAKVIVVTSEALKKAAAESENGGYGATQRIAITGEVVSYTNPVYWANGYQMANDLTEVTTALEKALGNKGEFGSKDGMTIKALRGYHYTMMMPYFTDPIELATYPSYKEAVAAVDANLKASKGGTKFVYRVDIPDKDETVFGMGILGDKEGADNVVMKTLNEYTKGPKHTAYMPYELLVSGTKVYMLHGKFRIALSFPDLSMWQFMKIRNAPGGIEKAATEAVAQ